MLEPPEAGRTAWTHGDPMNREFTMFSKERWSNVFHPDTRSSGHNNDIGICVESAQDGAGVVGNKAGKIGDASIALHQGGKHRTIGVDNAMTARARAGRQQFVTGYDQPNSWPPHHGHLVYTDGTQYTQVLWSQQASWLK